MKPYVIKYIYDPQRMHGYMRLCRLHHEGCVLQIICSFQEESHEKFELRDWVKTQKGHWSAACKIMLLVSVCDVCSSCQHAKDGQQWHHTLGSQSAPCNALAEISLLPFPAHELMRAGYCQLSGFMMQILVGFTIQTTLCDKV